MSFKHRKQKEPELEAKMPCCNWCCNRAYGKCRTALEPCLSFLRVMENCPGIGHLVAAFYACAGNKDKAERAGLKATVGVCMCICNAPAEFMDEVGRHRSEKLWSAGLTPRSEWMKNHHRRTLRHICLPASHQTATYHMQKKLKPIPLVEGWSRCQRFDLDAQLYGGIRFFDLRLMTHSDKEIWTHHNLVICLKFKEVLETVRDFITENPSEIVCLYITNDGKSVDWGLCHTYLQEYLGNRMVPETMRDMLIGDIVDQGKNVVIFGVPGAAYSWQCLKYRWPNKVWPEEIANDLRATISDLSSYRPPEFFWYKAECTPNGAMIVRSLGGLPGVIAGECAEEKFEFIEDMAAATNHHILGVIKEPELLPFNALSSDYVNDEVIERIIDMNKQAQTGVYTTAAVPTVSPNLTAEGEDDVFVDSYATNSSFEMPMVPGQAIEVKETNM